MLDRAVRCMVSFVLCMSCSCLDEFNSCIISIHMISTKHRTNWKFLLYSIGIYHIISDFCGGHNISFCKIEALELALSLSFLGNDYQRIEKYSRSVLLLHDPMVTSRLFIDNMMQEYYQIRSTNSCVCKSSLLLYFYLLAQFVRIS